MAHLIVDRWFSKCSQCGGNADPTDRAHVHGGRGGGYDPASDLGRENGCGVAFTHHESIELAEPTEEIRKRLRDMFWGD